MLTIGIIVNADKDMGFSCTRLFAESILSKGGKVKVTADVANEIGLCDEKLNEEAVLDSSDIIVCLGGDGTFLKLARKVYSKGLPMIGINLGSLGFLTEVEKNDIDNAAARILEGRYEIEERMMLETVILRGTETIARDMALNDVVISRGALSRILHIKTYINDVFVDSFPGDGLIVSSPTGSTGYSLSAGGPIVEPDIDLMIVTPICPHILYSRSFITAGDRAVKAFVDESFSHVAMVTVDGQEGYEVRGGDMIEVRKAAHTVKLIKINSRNFFNILRSKIYFRGEGLKKDEI